MWNEPTSPTFLIVIAASIVAHVTVIAVMPSADGTVTPTPAPPMLVAIDAVTPPPPSPPPMPLPTALPPTVAARPVARSPRPALHQAPARPVVATADPPPTATEPADFSGVTLTNEGAGWSTPIGDGTPMTGPITTPGPPSPTPPRGHGHQAPSGDRLVALGDLSRPPRAPNLDAQLAANYPRGARLAGITGSAVIRVRILVDGRVGPTRVVSESAAGFGVACQHTLAGSRWQPPLDAHQQAVATDLAFTCTFAVAR
jgi:outer membrane biosynthesis protein TonB